VKEGEGEEAGEGEGVGEGESACVYVCVREIKTLSEK